MPVFQPVASWKGTVGPQNVDPMVPSFHVASSATHPLVTILAANYFSSVDTLSFDLVITDGPPPAGYAGAPAPSPSTTSAGPFPGWKDVVWDRDIAEPRISESVRIPSGDQGIVALDWPDTTTAGRAAPDGRYWAIVEVSGYQVSGPLQGGGLVDTGNADGRTTSVPTTGRTDLWTPLVLH